MAETFNFGTPGTTDANDGTTIYVMACHWTSPADGSWTGVEWRVPDTISGDNHYILAYQDGDSDTPRKSNLITPSPGGLRSFTFTTPLAITAGTSYRACVITNHYVFTSGYAFPQTDAHLTTDGFFLKVTAPDDAKYPDVSTALNFHISPIVTVTVPTITGTAAAALGALAATATGLYTAAGTAAATLGALLGAASGGAVVPGIAAVVLSGLTASAQVSPVVGPRSATRSQTDTERLAAQTIGGRLT